MPPTGYGGEVSETRWPDASDAAVRSELTRSAEQAGSTATQMYASNKPKLKLFTNDKDNSKREYEINFSNGVYTAVGEAEIERMERWLRDAPDSSKQLVRRVNPNAAKTLVEQHKLMRKQSAVQGVMPSNAGPVNVARERMTLGESQDRALLIPTQEQVGYGVTVGDVRDTAAATAKEVGDDENMFLQTIDTGVGQQRAVGTIATQGTKVAAQGVGTSETPQQGNVPSTPVGAGAMPVVPTVVVRQSDANPGAPAMARGEGHAVAERRIIGPNMEGDASARSVPVETATGQPLTAPPPVAAPLSFAVPAVGSGS